VGEKRPRGTRASTSAAQVLDSDEEEDDIEEYTPRKRGKVGETGSAKNTGGRTRVEARSLREAVEMLEEVLEGMADVRRNADEKLKKASDAMKAVKEKEKEVEELVEELKAMARRIEKGKGRE
jgi:predicted RNase H-like nuclease (RuvC/YqgF family)